jgi:hypothetical protein
MKELTDLGWKRQGSPIEGTDGIKTFIFLGFIFPKIFDSLKGKKICRKSMHCLHMSNLHKE